MAIMPLPLAAVKSDHRWIKLPDQGTADALWPEDARWKLLLMPPATVLTDRKQHFSRSIQRTGVELSLPLITFIQLMENPT